MSPLDLDLPLSVSPAMVSPTRRIIEAKLGPVLDDEGFQVVLDEGPEAARSRATAAG